MKSITVFTPSYNRAHLLPKLYESLIKQTSKDFVWMIIDDGSRDETKSIMEKWIVEADFEIQYHYKENGGMHTGHNLAYSLIDTELNVCIDSDDYMPIDAIAKLLDKWNSISDKKNVAGLIALDADTQGRLIGQKLPEDVQRGSYFDVYYKYKANGDKKFILRTDLLKEFPKYPEYKDEKLVPLGILYMMMGEKFPYVFFNEVVCIVDYQEGGSSNTIFKQYFQSPRGFAYARKLKLNYTKSIKEIIKYCVHLSALFFITKDIQVTFQDNKYKILSFLLLPFGFLLYLYLLKKR
ncbi:Glycosyl transferase family 2 [Soonwooa buanensis]|uniref:Glycosyl transferase family 2 n=2 Tax=Soonwooa buanensis TaxID=619805 RepID=A0A1T5FIX6_9FLAO|nr:Glycosyl transferase family 2 [Soonwooa buanensis]